MKKFTLLALCLTSFSGTLWAETTTTTTPKNAIIDSSMNLNKTMKTMGRNLRTIERSNDWAEKKTAAEQLRLYTAQAKALGLESPEKADDQEAYRKGMSDLYEQIVALEAAVVAQDEAKVGELLESIKKARRQGHQYFKVD